MTQAPIIESFACKEDGLRVDIDLRTDGRFGVTLFDSDAGESLGVTYVYEALGAAQNKARAILGLESPK